MLNKDLFIKLTLINYLITNIPKFGKFRLQFSEETAGDRVLPHTMVRQI